MSQSFGGALAPAANQTISFSEIPYNIQVPGTYYEVRPNYSQSGLLSYPAKALIIGQMITTANDTAPDGAGTISVGNATPNVPYPVYSLGQAQALFGAGSIVAQMVQSFLLANPWLPLDVIGVADAAGATQATGGFSISGTATANGTLSLSVGGIFVQVPVASGQIAGSVTVSAGQLVGELCPIDATGDIGALKCVNAGTLGNTIDLRVNPQAGDVTPPGLTVTATPFTGGATDPSIANALSAIATSWYTDIVMCFNDTANVTLLEEALATRYQAMGKLDAQAYRAIAGTPGTMQGAQGAYNSQYASVIGFQNPLNPTWVIAAAYAGVCSYNLANDPSRQLRDLALPGIIAPAAVDQFTETERNILLAAGISTFNVQVDGTVTIERAVSEYLLASGGVPDTSWHDIMVAKTMSRIRYDWVGYVSLTYPRNKLADDGTLAAEFDPTVVTPSRLQSSWAGRSQVYAKLGWIEHSTALAKQAVFVRDLTDPNRVNARQQVQIIGNLMVLAGRLEFSQ